MSKTLIITTIVVAIIAIVTVVVMLLPSNSKNVDDTSKFNRTFSSAEQDLIRTTSVTQAQLEEANGEDGHPAWIAINAVVYDVSNAQQWKAPSWHHGVRPGGDVTDAFLKSGHGVDHIQKLPVVGGYRPTVE